MPKIALARVLDDHCSHEYDTFKEFHCLDFKEVTDAELKEYREAIKLHNYAPGAKHKLVLIEPVDNDYYIKLLSDLKEFRAKELARQEELEAARRAHREEKARKAKETAQKRLAKQLGIALEELITIQQRKKEAS